MNYKYEPLPCPFCGWGTIVNGYLFRYGCECHSCGAKTARFKTWNEAVSAWNKRTKSRGGESDAELSNAKDETLLNEEVD